MKPPARRLPLTSVAVVLAIFVLSAPLLGVNLIQLPFGCLAHIEQDEIDDIITAAVVVIAAFIVDRVIAARSIQHETRLQTEQLRVVQVTMQTVQDIVNNCLNQLQLVRFEAEGHISPESLAIFDEAIQETAGKLRTLGDLEAYTEHHMVAGTGLGPTGTPS